MTHVDIQQRSPLPLDDEAAALLRRETAGSQEEERANVDAKEQMHSDEHQQQQRRRSSTWSASPASAAEDGTVPTSSSSVVVTAEYCPIALGRFSAMIGALSVLASIVVLSVPGFATKPSLYSPRTSCLDVAVLDAVRTVLVAYFLLRDQNPLFGAYAASFCLILGFGKMWAFKHYSQSPHGDLAIVVSTTIVGLVQFCGCIATAMHHDARSEGLSAGGIWLAVKPFFVPVRWQARLTALGMWAALIAAEACAVYAPLQLAKVVTLITRPSSSSWVPPSEDAVIGALTLYLVLLLFPKLLRELRDVLYSYLWWNAYETLTMHTFNHIHRLPAEWHTKQKLGEITTSIGDGVDAADTLVFSSFVELAPSLWSSIAALIVVIVHLEQPLISAVTFIGFALYIWVTLVLKKEKTHEHDDMSEAIANLKAYGTDALLNWESIKYFGREGFMADKMKRHVNHFRDTYLRVRVSHSSIDLAQSVIHSGTRYAALLVGALSLVLHWNEDAGEEPMTIAKFVAINEYLSHIFDPLEKLGMVVMEIIRSVIDLKELIKILETPQEPPDAEDAFDLSSLHTTQRVCKVVHFTRLNPETGVDETTSEEVCIMHARGLSIEFENVNFRYPKKTKYALTDISFFVPASSTLGIVGDSGSSKSTLMRLLFRFYDPDSGTVKVAGRDIKTVRRESLREALGIVEQNPSLFHDTLRENILFGNPAAAYEDTATMVKRVHLDDVVAALPQGCLTVVGQRGRSLSGGEVSRVALARSMLREASVMVFDEATSSLDANTEFEIHRAMQSFVSDGRTTIIIAHKLATVRHADLILVMRAGRIVERGTHDQLRADPNSYYNTLWRAQEHLGKQQAGQEETPQQPTASDAKSKKKP